MWDISYFSNNVVANLWRVRTRSQCKEKQNHCFIVNCAGPGSHCLNRQGCWQRCCTFKNPPICIGWCLSLPVCQCLTEPRIPPPPPRKISSYRNKYRWAEADLPGAPGQLVLWLDEYTHVSERDSHTLHLNSLQTNSKLFYCPFFSLNFVDSTLNLQNWKPHNCCDMSNLFFVQIFKS